MLSEPEGGSIVRPSSMQELPSTMPNLVPLGYSSGKTIPADDYEATGSLMPWEGRHGATDVTEQLTEPLSYITTSDGDVLNNGAYKTWMSETLFPSAGYIVGLTEDSSKSSEIHQLQVPMTELKEYLPDSSLKEPSDGSYHGQTIAKITAPISAKVTKAETRSHGISAIPSRGSLSLSRTFQASTNSQYVLESLGWYVAVQTSSSSDQRVTQGPSAIQYSTTNHSIISSLPVTSTTLAENDVDLDGSKASRNLSKQSLQYILGTVFGAGVVIICIVYLHRPCYRYMRQARRGTILIAHVPEGEDANRLVDCQGLDRLEVSRFSLDS
ncbi:uncharacterized protein N7511_004315 [Penicillium nucicola]|uniref:uncharacterized protein n=1 Tax=Penicillium nucicola TaxID=1850975 RepID=UPI0025455359|nr:uncharacterized protein N7511_004315 [Penicillium nucicola]KAJ5766699.1 hypothetical protein N7511_004315 [Penicillium nucicola]